VSERLQEKLPALVAAVVPLQVTELMFVSEFADVPETAKD